MYRKYKNKDANSSIRKEDIDLSDIVTLSSGTRGKVFLADNGSFKLMRGNHGEFVDFHADEVICIERWQNRRVRLYQIEPSDREYIFQGYSFVKSRGRAAPPAELYSKVFDGSLGTDSLEEINRIFNVNHPEGYTGRSLSLSDIVELYDERGSLFFYCDNFGFKKIRFRPVTVCYMLITYNERDLLEPKMFSTLEKARQKMISELLIQLGGPLEDYDEGDDYGLSSTMAWSNPGSNWDWRILRISVDKVLNMKAALYYKTIYDTEEE